MSPSEIIALKDTLKSLAFEQGFSAMRVTDIQTSPYFERYQDWLEQGFAGDMDYLARNTEFREQPQLLHPGSLSVISFRYPYLPQKAQLCTPLDNQELANISRYALGRDYHKFLRKKLQRIAVTTQEKFDFDFRVFVDSAPVLETAFAEKSGMGWKGKHTLIIDQSEGSWFFLAEILLNIAIPADQPVENQCGACSACISICPTQAIIAPYQLDATRCISYLTIEHQGPIEAELRPLIGNHIYGCDDCQAICPWNRFSLSNRADDFAARNELDQVSLLSLWQWSEEEFLSRFEGSPIRRIGYQNWLRNLAIAIGNSQPDAEKVGLLYAKKSVANEMVCEHIDWAIDQLDNSEKRQELDSRHQARQKAVRLSQAIKKMTPTHA